METTYLVSFELLDVGLTDEVCDDDDTHGDSVHGDGEGARPDVGVPEARGPAGLHVDVRDPGDLHSDCGLVTGV